MYPFSFKEYVDYYNTKHLNELSDNEKLFNNYLNHGGLSGLYEIDETERVNYLKNMMDSVFIEDVVNWYIVCVELLRRRYSVKVGRVGGYAIDFVCTRNKDKIYVQVAYLLASSDVIEREFRPLLEVKDNYPKFVLSMDRFDFLRDGIQHMNIIDFLLDNS